MDLKIQYRPRPRRAPPFERDLLPVCFCRYRALEIASCYMHLRQLAEVHVSALASSGA